MKKLFMFSLLIVTLASAPTLAGRTTSGGRCSCGPDCSPETPDEIISPVCGQSLALVSDAPAEPEDSAPGDLAEIGMMFVLSLMLVFRLRA